MSDVACTFRFLSILSNVLRFSTICLIFGKILSKLSRKQVSLVFDKDFARPWVARFDDVPQTPTRQFTPGMYVSDDIDF